MNLENYIDSSKELMNLLFDKNLIEEIEKTELKPISWKGLDVTDNRITATFPNIKERFSYEWLQYFKTKNKSTLDLFLQSVYHYGYEKAIKELENE